jgi:hypothetical protein
MYLLEQYKFILAVIVYGKLIKHSLIREQASLSVTFLSFPHVNVGVTKR